MTQAQWEAVMGVNPSNFKGADRPVEKVSWNDAQAFIEKLNAQNDGYRYRLPTEAEWEYAARAGTKTAYSFGDNASLLGEYAWYDGNSGNETHAVASKKPNAWGLYDMHGNVWELVEDYYTASLGTSSVTDPKGPSSGDYRVIRGGSWDCYARNLRSIIDPGIAGSRLGLRLSRARAEPVQ